MWREHRVQLEPPWPFLFRRQEVEGVGIDHSRFLQTHQLLKPFDCIGARPSPGPITNTSAFSAALDQFAGPTTGQAQADQFGRDRQSAEEDGFGSAICTSPAPLRSAAVPASTGGADHLVAPANDQQPPEHSLVSFHGSRRQFRKLGDHFHVHPHSRGTVPAHGCGHLFRQLRYNPALRSTGVPPVSRKTGTPARRLCCKKPGSNGWAATTIITNVGETLAHRRGGSGLSRPRRLCHKLAKRYRVQIEPRNDSRVEIDLCEPGGHGCIVGAVYRLGEKDRERKSGHCFP